VHSILGIIVLLIRLYIYLIMLPLALLSWFRIRPGTTLARVQVFLYRATEPVLRPVRRIIPPMGGLDISFLVVILLAQFVIIPVLQRQ
jgi:YggT family protein